MQLLRPTIAVMWLIAESSASGAASPPSGAQWAKVLAFNCATNYPARASDIGPMPNRLSTNADERPHL